MMQSLDAETPKFRSPLLKFSVLLLLTIGGLMISTYLPIKSRLFHSTQLSSIPKPQREIMLFGDSLIGVSEREFGISDQLERDIMKKEKKFEVIVKTSGVGGNKAADLLRRVDSDVLSRRDDDGGSLPPPDAVIVLFDSDAADVDEGNNAEWLRQRYRQKMNFLLEKLTAKIGNKR